MHTWGTTDIFFLKSWSPVVVVKIVLIQILPVGSDNLKRAEMSELFPAPVLPTIPTYKEIQEGFRMNNILHGTWTGDLFLLRYYTCFNAILPNHPTLSLSQSPKDCSIYLCLFCCLAYRVNVTIFLNSIYMLYTVLVFFIMASYRILNIFPFVIQ